MAGCKKISCLLIGVLAALLLSGCMGTKMTVTIGGDGTCGYKLTYLYEKSMYDRLEATGSLSGETNVEVDSALNTGDFSKEVVTINEISYYQFSREFAFPSLESMQAFLTNNDVYYHTLTAASKNASAYEKDSYKAPFSTLTLGTDTFIGQMASAAVETGDSNKVDSVDMKKYNTIGEYYKAMGLIAQVSVTLPGAVSESNGTIEGNTVTWSIENMPDDGKLIAVSGNNPVISSDYVPPVIRGVKNNGLYKKSVTVTASDNVSLTSLRLNGKGYNTYTYKIEKTGSYTLTAKDANHNQTTVKFKIDKVKPTIKGAVSGKTYRKAVKLRFSDRNGIKSAKVNGKSVSRNKVTLKKRRAYSVKVTDKAGNVRCIKFRIA